MYDRRASEGGFRVNPMARQFLNLRNPADTGGGSVRAFVADLEPVRME